MNQTKKSWLSILVFVMLLGAGIMLQSNSAQAQTMKVTPSGKLKEGSNATISYENKSLAGQTITVEVSGGYPVVFTENVQITLDADGKGTGTWKVAPMATWMAASFNAPAVAEITLPITNH